MKSLKFQKGDLTSIYRAVDSNELNFSGYWQFVFDRQIEEVESSLANIWYIYFSKGKIVFSSSQEINFSNILKVLKNYLPALRNPEAKSQAQIEKLVLLAEKKEHTISLLKLLVKLTLDTKLVEYPQVIEAIQTHILNDFDRYLFASSATISVVADKTIDMKKPLVGFDSTKILDTVREREIKWRQLRTTIPSLNIKASCNEQNPQWKSLPPAQKKKIERLVNSGDSLEQIKYNLGEDKFKITQIFARLAEKKLVILGSSNINESSIPSNSNSPVTNTQQRSSPPQIAIIDDSPVFLQQFKTMVTKWGYTIRSCDDAREAVDFLLKSPPAIIFLDVNMPHLSGFDSIKKIRIQPKLTSIPIIILTAENTTMNNYRAKWSKSIFLTKPLAREDVRQFKLDLKDLLEKMLDSSE